MKQRGLKFYNVIINYDLWMTMTYFMTRSTYVAYAFVWGKLLKCHLKGKSCRKWANGLKVGNSEKNWTPGVGLPPPRGNIHVYYKSIQRSSSLKPLGQSKPNFFRKHLWEGGINVFINNPGHMAKMAAMSVYGKNA